MSIAKDSEIMLGDIIIVNKGISASIVNFFAIRKVIDCRQKICYKIFLPNLARLLGVF